MSPTTPIALDRSSREPLYRQIEMQLRAAIRDGRLRPGTTLPGIRTLAKVLGVGRNTVAGAYEQLASEGFIEGHIGSGTRVAADPPGSPSPPGSRSALGADPPRSWPSPGVRDLSPGLRGPLPDVSERSSAGPETIDLRAEASADDEFPFATWERLLREAVHELSGSAALLGTEPEGDPRLREVLAVRLGASRGLRCHPSQVVVTTGDWAAVSTIADAWPDPGPWLIEDPGEPWLTALLEARGRRIFAVAADERGLRPDDLPVLAGMPGGGGMGAGTSLVVHLTPAWGAVLGGTLPLERRRELVARLDRAARIVEDDRDGELRLEGPPPPALAAQDPLGRVVHVRGLERDLYPGARLGYIVVPPDGVERMRSFLEAQARGPGTIEQRTLARFIEAGLFDRHLRRRRARLVAAQGATLEALDRHARGRLLASPVAAGRHVVARLLDPRVTAEAVADAAARRGVLVSPLPRMRSSSVERLAIGFAGADPVAIRAGIRRLVAALDALGRASGRSGSEGRGVSREPPRRATAWTGASAWPAPHAASVPAVRGARGYPR